MFAFVKISGDTDFQIIDASRIHNLEPPVNGTKFYNVKVEDSFKTCVIAFLEDTKEALEAKIASTRPRIAPAPLLREASDISNLNGEEKTDEVRDKVLKQNTADILESKLAAMKTASSVATNDGGKSEEVHSEKENMNENQIPRKNVVIKKSSSKKATKIKAQSKAKRQKKRRADNDVITPQPKRQMLNNVELDTVDKGNSVASTISLKSDTFNSVLGLRIPHVSLISNNTLKQIALSASSAEPQRVDSTKNDPPKIDSPKVNPPKIDSSKVLPPTIDRTKIDGIKFGTTKIHRAEESSGSLQRSSVHKETSITSRDSSEKKKEKKYKPKKQKKVGDKERSKSKKKNMKCQCPVILECLADLRSSLEKERDAKQDFEETILKSLKTLEDNWKEIRSVRESAGTDDELDLENFKKPPQAGFIRMGDHGQTIHCGQGIWIPKLTYDNAVKNARTNAQFVKNISLGIFGFEELRNSSITGSSSNRTKSAAKPQLDPTKSLAVRDIFRHYLKNDQKCSETTILSEMAEYLNYIRGKISDMNRRAKPKRLAKTEEDEKIEELNDREQNEKEENEQKEEEEDPKSVGDDDDSSGDDSGDGDEDDEDDEDDEGDNCDNDGIDIDDSGLT